MSETKALYLLIAPAGQLSGNGQLRETIKERRNRKGEDVPFWYLSPELVKKFDLSDSEVDSEAVIAAEQTAINWLQLRFGGKSRNIKIDVDLLREEAYGLPPAAIHRDIGVH